MKTDVSLYQLTTHPLEKVLPRLLEKIYEGNMRALVLTDSQERMEFLNSCLWTYSPGSFLPHGMDGISSMNPEDNPFWITLEATNKNRADVLVLTGGTCVDDFSAFSRCVDIFDGNDDEALSAAVTRRSNYQTRGYPVVYWKQSLQGAWEKE